LTELILILIAFKLAILNYFKQLIGPNAEHIWQSVPKQLYQAHWLYRW